VALLAARDLPPFFRRVVVRHRHGRAKRAGEGTANSEVMLVEWSRSEVYRKPLVLFAGRLTRRCGSRLGVKAPVRSFLSLPPRFGALLSIMKGGGHKQCEHKSATSRTSNPNFRLDFVAAF
jgi:hypothetical protein